MLCPACSVILYEKVTLKMLRKGAKSLSPCALSTPSLMAMKRTPFCGKIISLIWTRPQKLWSGVADNTLRNRRKVSFLRRDCLTLTCVLTNAPKYDNLTQVSKTPKEGPV